jgi:hypothetical protein
MILFRSLGLLLLGGCAGATLLQGDDFRERLLATLPDDASLHGLASFSEDGAAVAYVERGNGGQRAVCGAWKSRPFTLVC